MPYNNLPAGLQRRLTYSEELRLQNNPRTFRERLNDLSDIVSASLEVGSELLSNFGAHSSKEENCLISKNLIKKTKIRLSTGTLNFCVICQDNICSLEIIRTICKCRHTFHLTCIDTWFTKSSNVLF